MNLTPDQAATVAARGCRLLPADGQQVALLSMQRRVFWINGEPWLIVRQDGFYETAATLIHLLGQPGPATLPPAIPPEATLPEAALPEAPLPGAEAEPVVETEPAEVAAPSGVAHAAEPAGLGGPALPEPAASPPALPLPPPVPVTEPETVGLLLPEPALPGADLPAAEPVPPPVFITEAPKPSTVPASVVLTAEIVARYVSSAAVEAADLPELIRSIHRSVCTLRPARPKP